VVFFYLLAFHLYYYLVPYGKPSSTQIDPFLVILPPLLSFLRRASRTYTHSSSSFYSLLPSLPHGFTSQLLLATVLLLLHPVLYLLLFLKQPALCASIISYDSPPLPPSLPSLPVGFTFQLLLATTLLLLHPVLYLLLFLELPAFPPSLS